MGDIVTKTKLENASVDCQTLEDCINGPADTKVLSRLGRYYWTLATIDSKVNSVVVQSNSAINDINNAKNSAQGVLTDAINDFNNQGNSALSELQSAINTIVIDDGVPALVVSTSNGTNQQQINDAVGAGWYAKSGGYALGDRVRLLTGEIVQSTVNANTNNPNFDMTEWKISNGNIDFYDFSDLRSYKGGGVVCYVAKDGIAGHFLLSSNTTTADNNGTVIVDAKNRRWKRSFDGAYQVKWFDIKPDSTEDNTTKINNAIDFISNLPVPENGNVLEFDSGVYYANIEMKSRIRLHGKGINTTVIKAIAESTTPVLNVPATVAFFGWQDISFDGNKQNGATGKGIYILPSQTGDVKPDKITDKSATGGAPYRYNTSSNFSVSNCKDNGLHVGEGSYGNYALMWDMFHSVHNDGHGFYNSSTDNTFINFYLERNGKAGLYNVGNNNKFIGFKAIWNGAVNPAFAGIYSIAKRCDFVAAEAQDNFCSGAILGGDDSKYDLLIDSNGYLSTDSNKSSREGTGIYFANGKRVHANVRVTNYRGGRLGDGFFPLEYTYRINDGVTFSHFDIKAESCCANKSPTGYVIPSTYSAPVVSNRASSVTVGGVTYTADQPVIIAGEGLYINESEKVELCSSTHAVKDFGYAIEFEYNSSTATAPKIVRANNDKFKVHLVRASGSNDPYFQIDIVIGGTNCFITLKGSGLDTFNTADLYSGAKFLIKGTAKLRGSQVVLEASLCFLDAVGYIKTIVNTRTYNSITATEIGTFENVVFNEEVGQQWVGKLRGIALFSESTLKKVDFAQFVNAEGLSIYNNCGGIYADFLNYNKSSYFASIRLSVPVASSYYHGMRLQKLGGAGVADIDQVCAKGADNLYTWKSVY